MAEWMTFRAAGTGQPRVGERRNGRQCLFYRAAQRCQVFNPSEFASLNEPDAVVTGARARTSHATSRRDAALYSRYPATENRGRGRRIDGIYAFTPLQTELRVYQHG